MEDGARSEGYPREARIRGGREIRRLFREGRRVRAGPVDVFALRSERGRPRLGVVVPLHGHSAVERNRVRRRLKEIARRSWLAEAWERRESRDVLIRARPSAYARSFDQLRSSLLEAFEALCSDG